jgi:hypothetical protein
MNLVIAVAMLTWYRRCRQEPGKGGSHKGGGRMLSSKAGRGRWVRGLQLSEAGRCVLQ